MKRLLVFSHAGVLEVNRALFQSMAKIGKLDVRMIVPKKWKGDLIEDLSFRRSEADYDLQVYSSPAAGIGNGSLFFYLKGLKKLLKGWQPDYVFVDEEPWSISAFQAFLAFRNRPRSFFTKQNLRKNLPKPFKMIERWVFAQSERAYVVADEAGDVLRSKGYKKEIHYLPHSYDPTLFKAISQEEKNKRRKELGIPEKAIVVAYFGRLAEEKGIEDLLEAIRLMEPTPDKASGGGPYFLFVGNGPLRKSVQSLIESLPPKTSQWIEALPHHRVGVTLAMCDVLVLPSRTTKSWKEQYGRILVEAMGCGVAVLGSDSGEIPTLIGRTGGGLVFREQNPRDLFEKLQSLVESPSLVQKLADAGSSYVRKNLTHDSVAEFLCKDLGLGGEITNSPTAALGVRVD